jgi:hypothetical protein
MMTGARAVGPAFFAERASAGLVAPAFASAARLGAPAATGAGAPGMGCAGALGAIDAGASAAPPLAG